MIGRIHLLRGDLEDAARVLTESMALAEQDRLGVVVGSRVTAVSAQTGQDTSPRELCASKSSPEPNQPSNR